MTVLTRVGKFANNSSIAGGLFSMAGTRFQKDAGVDDSPELFISDILNANGGSVNRDLVSVMASMGAELYEWLTGLVAVFARVRRLDRHSAPRSHEALGASGRSVVEKMFAAAVARDADVRPGTTAAKLIQDETGAVRGVAGKDPRGNEVKVVARKGVVLAADGYARGKELMRQHIPAHAGPAHPQCGRKHRPDGVRMGMAAGGQLMFMGSALVAGPVSAVGKVIIFHLLAQGGIRAAGTSSTAAKCSSPTGAKPG